MPYITPFEHRAREKGRQEGLRAGLLEGIELGLKLRFGAEGLQDFAAIQQCDIESLRRIKQALEAAAPLDDIRRLLS